MSKGKIIWIIDPYSNPPVKGMRPGRYHQITENLTNRGYSAKLFVSNFSHQTKTKSSYINSFFFDSIEYFVFDGRPYESHISLSRIKFEKDFINKFLLFAEDSKKPDLIIIRDPALFISTPLIHFCRENSIRYLVDIIDLWPELFELFLPSFLQKYAKYIFSFFYKRRRKLLSGASAYSAVAPDYLKVATDINNSLPAEVVYWGCDLKRIKEIQYNADISLLNEFNLVKNTDDFWLIYSGTLGDNYDIKSIFKVAEELRGYKNIKFIVAGSGPLRNWIDKNIDNHSHSNIYYLGQIKSDKLFALFKFCDIGLCTYASKSTVSMPIKSYDYLASGLPLINCLGRNLGRIVDEHNLGYNYISENIDSLKSEILKAYLHKEELQVKKNDVISFASRFDQDLQYDKFSSLVEKLL